MYNDMAIIGERDAVVGFGAVGVTALSATSAEEAERALRRCAQNGVKVVFITEDLAEQIPDALERYRRTPFPAVVPIPGSHPTGFGMRALRLSAEKAIGADILFQKEE